MSYQIGFDGAVTAEVQHLLRAVADQMRWGVSSAQAAEDAPASLSKPGSGSTTVPVCPPGQICPWTKIPQDPYVVIVAVVVGLAIGLAIGLGIGYGVGRRSVQAT